MVDNPGEKVDECPLNRGRLCTIGTAKTVRYTVPNGVCFREVPLYTVLVYGM